MSVMPTLDAETEAVEYIIGLVYDRCRVRLHQGKEALIRARLGKRMRHYGFNALSEYCRFLRTTADEAEFVRLVDALTTNFTNFFREQDHFQLLVNTALPDVVSNGKKHFAVWSAACSTGEEPYTLAICLAEEFPLAAGWDWHITASDISTKALEKARAGIYTQDRLGTVPAEWLRKYFQKGVGKWEGHCRIKRTIAERVDFAQINLTGSYEFSRPFEVIFCRNVMIYFDRQTQQQLVNQLYRFLAPGGYLFVGHSESLNGLKVPLRCLRPSVYQRSGS